MDMQKQIKTVMAKTQSDLNLQKAKCRDMVETIISSRMTPNRVQRKTYTEIGVRICQIRRLDKMILEQQHHANKVFLLDFFVFPIVALLKVIKIFKK
jgi:hypothetical protein